MTTTERGADLRAGTTQQAGSVTYTGRHRDPHDRHQVGFGCVDDREPRHAARPGHLAQCQCHLCTAQRRPASLGGAR